MEDKPGKPPCARVWYEAAGDIDWLPRLSQPSSLHVFTFLCSPRPPDAVPVFVAPEGCHEKAAWHHCGRQAPGEQLGWR